MAGSWRFLRKLTSAKVRIMNRAYIKRTFALLLAVLLAGTPLSAVFAASGETHAVRVARDDGGGVEAPPQAGHDSKTCTQHDSCVGQCCACCAHCVSAVFLAPPVPVHARAVQTPASSQLHPFFLIASPDRPPRLISL